ncbi:MAG: hypothetical protein AAGF95_24030 [Chloroflexota bacterium]
MSTPAPHLDDSLLPAAPAWSFVFAYEDIRGRGATHGSLVIAGQRAMPDTWRTWIDPIAQYVMLGTETVFPDLPYSRLALLFYSLAIEYVDDPAEIEVTTYRVGQHWWGGTNVVSRRKPFMNMQTYLSSTIHSRIQEYIDAQASTIPAYRLAVLRLDACMATVSDWTGIRLQVIQSSDGVRVDIDRCPFCLYDPSHCQIFVGLMEGMLNWLDTTIARQNVVRRLKVNLSQSSGHSIVFDWKAT